MKQWCEPIANSNCPSPFVARLLATQWRKAQPQSEVPSRILKLPKDSEAFSNYYDKVQDDLLAISGMDELLAGTLRTLLNTNYVCKCTHDCTML